MPFYLTLKTTVSPLSLRSVYTIPKTSLEVPQPYGCFLPLTGIYLWSVNNIVDILGYNVMVPRCTRHHRVSVMSPELEGWVCSHVLVRDWASKPPLYANMKAHHVYLIKVIMPNLYVSFVGLPPNKSLKVPRSSPCMTRGLRSVHIDWAIEPWLWWLVLAYYY